MMDDFTISAELLETLLQLGGQYAIPIAVLLRALYSGARGKLPEGMSQIAVASLFAGLTAGAGGDQAAYDVRAIAFDILGNTVFTAGLLAFIVLYLIRLPFQNLIVDGTVGGVLAIVSVAVWTFILGNDLAWWLIPPVIAGGVAGFIALRFGLRQLVRLVRIATVLIVIGLFLVAAAAGLWVLQLIV